MKPPEIVTATRSELDAILVLVAPVLPPPQYQLLQGVLQTLEFLMLRLQDAKLSLRRLQRMLFGAATERQRDVLKDSADGAAACTGGQAPAGAQTQTPAGAAPGAAADTPAAPPRKGHGRHGAAAYAGATVVECEHQELQSGQLCPQCEKGKVYASPPKVIVKVVGQAPLAATVYRVQRLRCRLCDTFFTAPVPAQALGPKYDLSCASMIAMMRYGFGLPSYRLQALHASLHVPLPDATQWDIICKSLPAPRCVHAELIRQAAQAPLLYCDDTPMLVLKPNKQPNKPGKKAQAAGPSGAPGELNALSEVIAAATPKGTRTTCIVAQAPKYEVVLYFTGHAHAGQNMEKVLVQRAPELAPVLQMCDALAANTAGDFITVLCHCLSHGRRQVVDVLEQFPEQGRHVLQTLGRVYFHDQHCREQRFDAAQRLEHHQRHSGPLMQDLKAWIEQRLQQREVEPNSGLGKALKYLLRHWNELTMFLRHAGAPLDNNLCEQMIKCAILHRKGSMFYRTPDGAEAGDIYMSLIHTCVRCGQNAFDYLQALHRNAQAVMDNPGQWLPWNWRQAPVPEG
jgi:transposase